MGMGRGAIQDPTLPLPASGGKKHLPSIRKKPKRQLTLAAPTEGFHIPILRWKCRPTPRWCSGGRGRWVGDRSEPMGRVEWIQWVEWNGEVEVKIQIGSEEVRFEDRVILRWLNSPFKKRVWVYPNRCNSG